MVEDQEQQNPETEDGAAEVWATIEDTKQQLAMAYLNFLDKKKWGMLATGAWLGVNINPLQKEAIAYLTTNEDKEDKGIFATLGKNIKKKIIEQVSGWTVLEYNKASLAKMKGLITQYKDDQTKLQGLMEQIQAGTDPTVAETTSPVKDNTTPEVVAWKAAAESPEKMSDRRNAVVKNIHAVLEQDQKEDVEYLWWWKNKITEWLDCSGLINYVVAHAWLDIWWDSRTMFKQFPTSKLEIDDNNSISSDVANIKEGDLMFWNSVKPWFTWPKHWTPPLIEKDWTSYCIHHVAFVKSINKEKWTVDVVQSSGGWVNKATINIFERSKHQDELYIASVDYEKLPTINKAKLAQLEVLPWAAMAA